MKGPKTARPRATSSHTAEVGYKRPPVHTRFQRGQSGNPRGRPSGRKSFQTLLNELLAQKISIREGDKVRRVTRAEAIMIAMINQSIKGNPRTAKMVLEATSGSEAEEPLTVVIRKFSDVNSSSTQRWYGPSRDDG